MFSQTDLVAFATTSTTIDYYYYYFEKNGHIKTHIISGGGTATRNRRRSLSSGVFVSRFTVHCILCARISAFQIEQAAAC